MKLHENPKLFQDAVIATSQQTGLREIYVEKDYWVTYVLYHIFKDDIGRETIFKGGTALLKCFSLIDRFSEDIDLVVLRNEHENANQLKRKIRNISKCVSRVLPEIDMDGITHKVGMIRKTAHTYPKTFTGHFGQVRDTIIVESTWFGNFEPYLTAKVSSFVYEMMIKNAQNSLVEQYGMYPFEVLVLNPNRTLCEKVMSLVRFSHTEQPITDLRNKIRHIYDIHLLLNEPGLSVFFWSKDFDRMLLSVARDDVTSFRNNNEWLVHHPKDALIFSDTSNTWNKLKRVYTGSFSELVFRNFPDETDIFSTLIKVAERLNRIEWNIKP